MEIIEVPIQERIDMVKQEIRSFEVQWLARSADETKYVELISAQESGAFRDWNKAIVEARVKEWAAQRDAARIDIKTIEISWANARRRLDAIELEKGKGGE